MIKYEVRVTQNLKYTETIVAEFDESCKAVTFAELMLKTCKKISVTIAHIEDAEEAQEGGENE